MGFSISKILKRDTQPEQQNNVQTEKPAEVENKSSESQASEKKHGEPGVCCGSCS